MDEKPVECGACGFEAEYVERGAHVGTPGGGSEFRIAEARVVCPMSDCGVQGPIRKTRVAAVRGWNRMWAPKEASEATRRVVKMLCACSEARDYGITASDVQCGAWFDDVHGDGDGRIAIDDIKAMCRDLGITPIVPLGLSESTSVA